MILFSSMFWSVLIFVWAFFLHANKVQWFLLGVYFFFFCGFNICHSVIILLYVLFRIILIRQFILCSVYNLAEGARQRYLFFKCLFKKVFIIVYLFKLVIGFVSNCYFHWYSNDIAIVFLTNISKDCWCFYGVFYLVYHTCCSCILLSLSVDDGLFLFYFMFNCVLNVVLPAKAVASVNFLDMTL